MASRDFAARFIDCLGTKRFIRRGDRVVAAVSSGADSVALLHLLREARNAIDFQLSLCHLNHKLRGSDADGDEQFVRDLAERWSIPAHFAEIDVRAQRDRRGGSLEEAARMVRYDFYTDAAEHLYGDCSTGCKVALAHHRDDQCETIIFNLIRGAGVHGLRGMPAVRPLGPEGDITIIRPLLDFSKAELIDYLRASEHSWREDRTNYQLNATRNVIRYQLLPALERVHQGFKEHLLQLGEQAHQCEELLRERSESVLSAVERKGQLCSIETWRVNSLPRIIAGEVVRRMMIDVGVSGGRITSKLISAVLDLARSNEGRISLPAGRSAWIENSRLFLGEAPTLDRRDVDKSVTWLNEACRFGDFRLTRAVRDFDARWFDNFLREKSRWEEAVNADQVQEPLIVRFSRPGDKFHPLGSPGAKKIGDFLTDNKVPIKERPAVVVADQSGPIWLVGHRIDERVKIRPSTRKVIILQAQTFHRRNAEDQRRNSG